jgi:hypothetical protein
MTPLYSVRTGVILSNGIRPISVAEARRLIGVYADCAKRAIDTFGVRDPDKAALIVADDLATAASLKRCIAAVEGFDPEPPANAAAPVAAAQLEAAA